MREFSEYEKMPNSLKKLELDEIDFARLEKLLWVVTEKVHGANFSFVYEQGKLTYAKRKAPLSWQDDFFGFQSVVSRIEDQVLSLFEEVSTTIKGNRYILYGELFGGKYPHPDVIPDPNVEAIQTGVYYAPFIEFCAFDLAIETTGADSKYYLDYKTTLSFLEKHKIFHAKALFIGKFGEAFNFNTRMNSTIPRALHLPELKDNLIEGVVIKPFGLLGNHSISPRPIVKIKNAEFEEENKYHQAQKWTYLPNVASKAEELSFLVEELRNYVTSNRLHSAISKIGPMELSNHKRMAEIRTEFLKDTLSDFNENNHYLLDDLSVEQQNWIKERIKYEINQVIHTFNHTKGLL
ncbi:2'-5' RNA ligase [Rhodocytophaga rosea]|uniref:2'-5' RNA ligase n=1 Tax=Rhodocytophaga rosea TaxID=2704465 RepID=A0A6C0GU44_9BACT|nr:RNA ligase family protein [Rhodocytophaga rosea]QHT70872.1 2'-5' RNA ligase [Rhodocytophaga rosea]